MWLALALVAALSPVLRSASSSRTAASATRCWPLFCTRRRSSRSRRRSSPPSTAVGTFGPYFAASLIVTPLALTTWAQHFRAVPAPLEGVRRARPLRRAHHAEPGYEILYAMAIGVLAFGEGQRVRESALGAFVMLLGMTLLALAT